ncbi:unnamed protein product [Paramecium primaurelia]|uniref:Uncharacterized protein n=1 Tax=Paramecium primaurelia TaxID=5886 RepID=A0A8S1P9P4_PARPR|nr:unnamed protein product [Paramecium primaurelia]
MFLKAIFHSLMAFFQYKQWIPKDLIQTLRKNQIQKNCPQLFLDKFIQIQCKITSFIIAIESSGLKNSVLIYPNNYIQTQNLFGK